MSVHNVYKVSQISSQVFCNLEIDREPYQVKAIHETNHRNVLGLLTEG